VRAVLQSPNLVRRAGEVMQDRYRVENLLGTGTFGRVVRAVDLRTRAPVAVKIIKSQRAFEAQARIEIKVLEALQQKRGPDGPDRSHTVRMLDQFLHHNHQCIVFELLSVSLFDLLRATKFAGTRTKPVEFICAERERAC